MGREQGGDPCERSSHCPLTGMCVCEKDSTVPITAHKARRGERRKGEGEVWGVMNNPCDCCLLLLHTRWKSWVQGDLRKLYVIQRENKGDINETAFPERYADSYVEGQGCENLETGLKLIRTPCLDPGDLKFYVCLAKSEGRPKYCRL